MNLPDGLLAGNWLLAAWLVFIPLLLRALWRAPWRHLLDGAQTHAWLGSIVALTLLWSFNAGIRPGLSLHLLGAALLTLAFGPHLAFIALCLVLAGVTANGAAGWAGYAVNALSTAGVGVLVAQAVLRFNERFLPGNLFVYIFANGFFGAALTVIAGGLSSALVLGLAGVYAADLLLGEYLPYVLLLAFSEAWLSGMMLTLFVVYRPEWVSTFEDSRYLRDK